MTQHHRQQFLQQFGRRVRASRILKGLTLKQCAALAATTHGNLSLVERGKRSVYAENIPTLARALGVTVGYLLGEEDEEDARPA